MPEVIESANIQEVAEPEAVVETAEVTDNQVDTAEEGAIEQEPATPVQSDEVNAQYAAARRKAEEEYQRKINRVDDEVKRLFGSYKNPITGKQIETFDEYIKAVEDTQRQAQEQELRDKGIDPAVIEQMVNNNPAVRQAQQYLEQSRQEEARRNLEADLKEITKIDPSIKSMEDLQNHVSFPAVLSYVRDNGLKLHDAFRLANYTQLSSHNADAARQAAINQARGKQHMETTNGISQPGSQMTPIPANLLSNWQAAYPGMSMEQLTKKYNESI